MMKWDDAAPAHGFLNLLVLSDETGALRIGTKVERRFDETNPVLEEGMTATANADEAVFSGVSWGHIRGGGADGMRLAKWHSGRWK